MRFNKLGFTGLSLVILLLAASGTGVGTMAPTATPTQEAPTAVPTEEPTVEETPTEVPTAVPDGTPTPVPATATPVATPTQEGSSTTQDLVRAAQDAQTAQDPRPFIDLVYAIVRIDQDEAMSFALDPDEELREWTLIRVRQADRWSGATAYPHGAFYRPPGRGIPNASKLVRDVADLQDNITYVVQLVRPDKGPTDTTNLLTDPCVVKQKRYWWLVSCAP